jgi:hypothetical protein
MMQGACKRMGDRRVGAALVTDRKAHLVGIFTGRDAVNTLAIGMDAASIHLRDVMTEAPHCMPPRSTAIEALRLERTPSKTTRVLGDTNWHKPAGTARSLVSVAPGSLASLRTTHEVGADLSGARLERDFASHPVALVTLAAA